MSLGTTARTSFLALDADTGTLMGWSLLTQTRLGRRTACGSHYHLEGAGMMPRPRPACSELEDALDRANTDLAGLGEHREDRAHRVLRHAEAPAELRRAHLTRSLGQAAEDVAVELAPEIHCGWTIRHEGPSVTMPRERHNHRGLDASRVSHEGLGGGVVTVARYDLTFAALVPVEIAWRRASAAVHERLPIDVDEDDGLLPSRTIDPDGGGHRGCLRIDALPHATRGPTIRSAGRQRALAFREAVLREGGQDLFRHRDPPLLRLHPCHPALTPKLGQAVHLSVRPIHRPPRSPPARLPRRSISTFSSLPPHHPRRLSLSMRDGRRSYGHAPTVRAP